MDNTLKMNKSFEITVSEPGMNLKRKTARIAKILYCSYVVLWLSVVVLASLAVISYIFIYPFFRAIS